VQVLDLCRVLVEDHRVPSSTRECLFQGLAGAADDRLVAETLEVLSQVGGGADVGVHHEHARRAHRCLRAWMSKNRSMFTIFDIPHRRS
jgi:hypothetical protein